MKYKKISKEHIIDVLVKLDWSGPGIISPSNIASILKTSRYQVDKHIKSLKQDNIIEYKSIMLSPEDDFYPPYNGYMLSKKGEDVYKAKIKKHEEEMIKIINKHFSK